MADTSVVINSLTVVKDTELEAIDAYVSEAVILPAATIDDTVLEARRWVLKQLRAAGVEESEVEEDNGDTQETNRQETLRDAAGYYWLHAAFRQQAQGNPNSTIMEKAKLYLARAKEEMKLVIGPPLLVGASATAESATSLGGPTPMRIGP